jgi:hypothetical protein
MITVNDRIVYLKRAWVRYGSCKRQSFLCIEFKRCTGGAVWTGHRGRGFGFFPFYLWNTKEDGMSELEIILNNLAVAKYPEAVFGIMVGDSLSKVTMIYKQLAKVVHEDLYVGADKTIAHEAFILLGSWYEQAKYKIANNTYGDIKAASTPKPVFTPIEFMVDGKELTLTDMISVGSYSTVYRALFSGNNVTVKIARTPKDNELLEQEIRTLNHFAKTDGDTIKETFYKLQRAYVPKVEGAFFIRDSSNSKFRASILSMPVDQCFTLKELVETKFPEGLDPKQAYWIYRRILMTLWMSQLQGYVHGAVTPEHVLVFPKLHGLILLDWCNSTKINGKVKAINPVDKKFYPPEVLEKKPVTPVSDIYMAGKTMLYMLGKQPIPDPIRKSIVSCTDTKMTSRPAHIGIYHDDFGRLLGKREYVEFVVD